MVAALMMTAGIALAEGFRGDDGPNAIEGTNGSDGIVGLAGDDDLYGLGGDDYIDVQGDGRVGEEDCGSGRDVVRANPEDNLDDSCEVSKAVEGPK